MNETKLNCSLNDTAELREVILANPELPLLIFCGGSCNMQSVIDELKEQLDYWKSEALKWCDKSFKLPTEEEFMLGEALEINMEELKKKDEYIKQLESRIKKMESDASWDKFPEMMGK